MRTARFCLWITVSLLAILVLAFGGSTHGQVRIHPVISAAVNDDDSDSRQPIKEQETIRKSFSLPAGERSLEIDNVIGFIEVTGSQTDQVQVVVNKTLRAESKEKMEKARKEVSLDITQEGGALKLYVNGPFRCNNCCCNGCTHSDEHEGYSVRMDFQIQVPSNIALKLKTVTGGHVQVKDVTGNYSVHNVNGGIDMQNVAGSGTARTVNGGVKVSFRENPRENSDFASINGSIDLYFARNLSADFRFKTMNGGIFTDYPMTSLPAHVSQGERRDGKFVFHADRFTGGRVGSGGPEIKAENINGSIRVLERQ
ncbi:MAG TPA: hypothetical protein VKY85_23565 [Candidatus Angelobacter sp.]|nr:hypothetical protein [Candidatus Angelobacter sp.]